jgi:phage shock protein C
MAPSPGGNREGMFVVRDVEISLLDVHLSAEYVMADLKQPLRRSRSNRMIAGVVGGLAEYFGIDPTLARVVYVVGSIVSAAFPGALLYAILWALIPEEPF